MRVVIINSGSRCAKRVGWFLLIIILILANWIPARASNIDADGHVWVVSFVDWRWLSDAKGGSAEEACKNGVKVVNDRYGGAEIVKYKKVGGRLQWKEEYFCIYEYGHDFEDDGGGLGVGDEVDNTIIVYKSDECTEGYSYKMSSGSCEPVTPLVQTCPVSHPVIPGVGIKVLSEQDSSGSVELPLIRAYRSSVKYGAKVGEGQWLFAWQRRVNADNQGASYTGPISVLRGDGSEWVFHEKGGRWRADGTPDVMERLLERKEMTSWWGGKYYGEVVTYRYTVAATGAVETYDANGSLQNVRQPGARPTELVYEWGRLVAVVAPSGRALRFAYDTFGRVASVAAPDGAVTKYAYNENDMLSTVTRSDNTTRQYVYEDMRFPTALTGVIDEAGVRYATYAYDDQSRAVISELTGGADRYQFQYGPDGQTTVLTPDGGSTVYSFLKQNGVLLPTGVSAPCPSCGKTSFSSEYDANGNATREVGYDGASTTYAYDAQGRETKRVEAAGTASAKTTTTEWHPTWNLPTRVASPGKLETFVYDANSRLTTYTVVETADANGSAGLVTAPDGPIKRTDWTYDDGGHVLTTTERTGNAVTATWTFVYNAQGDLQSLTNPEGKTGRIVQYDAAGRVLEAVDVNGVHLKFTYNARGWLTDYEFDGQHIRYEYDAIGQRTAVLGPQNLVTRYVYDAAHRLIEVLDNIALPENDAQTSSISPFGTAQTEQAVAEPTTLQALRDTVVRAWNGVIQWFKQWLSSIVASAHAQGLPPGGMSSYRPILPVPGASHMMNQSSRPEDVLDPNAGSAMHPEARVEVIVAKAVAKMVQACAAVFDRSTPPGDCDQNGYDKLKQNVDSTCKPEPSRCGPGDTQAEILKKLNIRSRCADARRKIMNTCFRGGDLPHISKWLFETTEANICKGFVQ